MGLYQWSLWLTVPGVAGAMVLASRRVLHYFQLESYQFQGYFRTLGRQWKKAFLPGLMTSAFCLVVLIFQNFILSRMENINSVWALLLGILTSIVCLAIGLMVDRLTRDGHAKKPFNITPRVKRLYGMYALSQLGITALVFCLSPIKFLIAYVPLILPLCLALAAILALPIEKIIFGMYFRDAQQRLLQDPHLIRIGITGSYGKTSVKFILNTILSQKYNVLATPASFNTPMGVTRIVRDRLTPAHQVFIAEMGARHVGEIRELGILVHPQVGILTSVGPQHLDTFRTIERIRDTKFELMQALPPDGLGVFCNDDAIVTELYARFPGNKALVGTESGEVYASDIKVSAQGSSFTLHIKGCSPIPCSTLLLGEHNIQNILLSCAVAHHLGLTEQQIARGIAALRPVEHRLQLIQSAGGITIIDDAFNSNPTSSRAALRVLSAFEGRRIIVTPGLVELGDKEEAYNRELGKAIAGAADLVFLVGKKHTAPILEGLLEAGFDKEKIYVADDLQQSTQQLHAIMTAGDVILYENDLPDNYSES